MSSGDAACNFFHIKTIPSSQPRIPRTSLKATNNVVNTAIDIPKQTLPELENDNFYFCQTPPPEVSPSIYRHLSSNPLLYPSNKCTHYHKLYVKYCNNRGEESSKHGTNWIHRSRNYGGEFLCAALIPASQLQSSQPISTLRYLFNNYSFPFIYHFHTNV